jgi:aspartate 4-decarboxylase
LTISHQDAHNLESMASLSPFELKDALIALAGGGAAERPANKSMLNAGRGNPNFLATVPRHGFWQLGQFAMRESERSFAYMPEGLGGFPKHDGLEERFDLFVRENRHVPGVEFLRGAISYVRDQLGLDAGAFLYELCEGILGANYPVPDRMLRLSETVVGHYLRREMIGKHPFVGEFDLFAVEGGTAAMTYLFDSMRINGLISRGDRIALGMPIFTPYIEIPKLADYQLEVVPLNADPYNGWQYPRAELDKLRDPSIKAFFLVNPSNPPSVALDDESLRYIAEIVRTERPDLIILTDDVYGTFADDFVSLFALCPYNTILVYSYSKYFGATGWRLGTIATHRDNVLDAKIAQLDDAAKHVLHERYESITTTPATLKFIDRVVADSRTVALNHTAGLSTPQQVQMVLFSLFSLMDTPDAYKSALKRLIRDRKRALYREIGVSFDEHRSDVDYYTILDLEIIGERVYGREFVEWVLEHARSAEMLVRLARESRVVLLPGRGFGTQHPSGRVSLANLNEADYMNIGRAIRRLLDDYHARFLAERATRA